MTPGASPGSPGGFRISPPIASLSSSIPSFSRALTQATVVTRTAVAADALSTAMLVSGRRPEGVLQAYRV